MKDTKVEIYNQAKSLFSQKGFKAASIANITKMAGIGVGTFYNFYGSKEEIFFEICLRENLELKKKIMNDIDLEEDPVEVLKEVVTKLFDGMRQNPILKEWYNRDTFYKILEKIGREKVEEDGEDFFYNFFLDIIEKWQVEGKIRRDIESDQIITLFNALSFVELHKEEIGNKYFPETMVYLVEFIAKGLKG
ncbi:MAG: TetR/AcrR family transcriptional regulator [Thermotaleaceae bacterium]